MAKKKIKGRIIRIIDNRTVIINLGLENNITNSSVFYILGEPETVIDPLTNEVLGTVNVTKSRVKSSQVFDKFTIATTSWTDTYTSIPGVYASILGGMTSSTRTEEIDEGELKVKSSELQPWKAKSESPVKIGDEVEVQIEEATSLQETTEETEE